MSTESISLRIHPPVPRRLNALPSPRSMRVRFGDERPAADRIALAWSRAPLADAAPAAEPGKAVRIPVK